MPARGARRVRLPLWAWSYVTFRFGDGLTSALIPLAIVLHYGMPLWMLALATAIQNLASVPATFAWASLMDRGVRRRPIVVAGFAVAAAALLCMATLPSFALFLAAAVVYTVSGVATGPAASTLVLQRVPRKDWSRHTAALARRTGTAFVLGLVTSIALTAPVSWWERLGGAAGALGGFLQVGGPHFAGQLAAACVMAASAALSASYTVPAYQAPLPHESGFDPKLVVASQRHFERPVFFMGRLRQNLSWPMVKAALGTPHRLWPIGYALTFMGSVCFFASYTGMLSTRMAFPAGLVLLASLPSNLVTPVAYPWAARRGARHGEAKAVLAGSLLRTLALPALCLLLGLADTRSYPVILLLHGLMGLSFALIQVNGPLLLAELHPGGRGQGVGTYHAAVGTGTMLGSLTAFATLALADYRASYALAILLASAGGATLWKAHRIGPPQAPSEATQVVASDAP